ncbi:MAG: putative phage abortive infection protein [Bacteroidaceae bacterium]|nr:putative phage abortive infection protein [Bacteroidaceae bacterium]
MKQNTKHSLKWLTALIIVGILFVFGFIPFAKWLFVEQTLALYEESASKFSVDDDAIPSYHGAITDTLFKASDIKKGKTDTIVHRQSIQLVQDETSTSEKPKREDVGVFGDSAGLLNAFFSFLAFMAVVVTMYLQSRRDGQDKQNGARVLFEQEFFAMVGMLENIVAHLKFTDNKPVEDTKMINDIVSHYYQGMGIGLGKRDEEDKLPDPVVVEGREVFRYIYSDRENYNLLQYVSKEKDLRQSAMAQEMCFDGTLDHYFRYLYRILKHIDESKLLDKLDNPKKEREYYAHLLRAQLSNYELKMLFYNGLLGENPNTIKILIERYAMFNNLRAWELGKFQKEYYQAIMDEEIYEDPEGFDPQTTYSVTAFWDDRKLREFKKRDKKNPVKVWYYAKMGELASWMNKKYGQEYAETEIVADIAPVVVKSSEVKESVEQPKVEEKAVKPVEQKKGNKNTKPKSKKKKNGRRKH